VLGGIPMQIFALEHIIVVNIQREFKYCGPFYGDQYLDCIISNGKMSDEKDLEGIEPGLIEALSSVLLPGAEVIYEGLHSG
jgi:hypothetical protein